MAWNRRKTPFLSAPRALAAAGIAAALVGGACFNSDQPSRAQVTGVGQDVLRLLGMSWGRIVDLLDASGVLVESDILVRPDVQSDGINYVLSTNPINESETLQILQPAGSGGFNTLRAAAEAGLGTIAVRGPLEPPPFDMLPRNAGLQLKFSEFVDPATVDNSTIQVWVGDPPLLRLSVRFVVRNDPVSGQGCVLIDPTISARQSSSLGLPQNAVGFPSSTDAVNDNVLIRIPTAVESNFGQPEVLRNSARTRRLSPGPDDPTETSLGGNPVVLRAFRSGNEADPNNGFMADLRRPNLITQMQSAVAMVAVIGTGRELTYSINVPNCASLAPKVGDLHEIGTGILLVNAVVSSGNPAAYVVRGNLLEGDIPPGDFSGSPLVGRLTTRYTGQDAAVQGCYLLVNPPLPLASLPAQGIDPHSSITVQFDEPIDGSTVVSMHSLVLTQIEAGAAPSDPTAPYQAAGPESVPTYIDRLIGFDQTGDGGRILFGPVEVNNGNRSFTLTPAAGFADANGGAFDLALALRDGSDGIRDLAGNPLNFSSFVAGTPIGQNPATFITVLGGPIAGHYFALRALSMDEDNDNLAEFAGQVSPGPFPGTITGRPLTRFSKLADSSNQWVNAGVTVPSNLTPFEPLNPAGSVTMTLYRPHDMGFGYLDPNEFNLDVEGFNWAPSGGLVFDDTVTRFSLALAHANRMPDELLNLNALPQFPFTGLRTGSETFSENILGFPTFDEKIVFDTLYTIRSINLFTATSLVSMLPMPVFASTYTWRDTSIPQTFTGAPNGAGSPPVLHTFPPIWPTPPYGGILDEPAPSVGLPLLVRFRAFPMGERIGINRFQVSRLMVTSSLPAFRIFSSGGQDGGGAWHLVIPDNAAAGGTKPIGGFSQNGSPTRNEDPFVYWAQTDFVVRVSRVHTHWFAFGGQLDTVAGINLEPDLINQPPGTQVQLEFRGSVEVSDPPPGSPDPGPLSDAETPFDDYADFLGIAGSVASPTPWTTDLSSLAGTNQYFQIRLTFIANIQQNLESIMDGLGIAWTTN